MCWNENSLTSLAFTSGMNGNYYILFFCQTLIISDLKTITIIIHPTLDNTSLIRYTTWPFFSFFSFFLFLTLHHSTPMTLKVIKVETQPKRMALLANNNSMELIKGKEMLNIYLITCSSHVFTNFEFTKNFHEILLFSYKVKAFDWE